MPPRPCPVAGLEASRSVSAAILPNQPSKPLTTLACAAGFLLLAILLVCAWTRPSAYATGLSNAQVPESARHAQGTDQGETPWAVVGRQQAMKQRRSQSTAPAHIVALIPQFDATKVFTTIDPDRQLDMAAQQASQRHAHASRLQLKNPALRLHPGHAPPQRPPAVAG